MGVLLGVLALGVSSIIGVTVVAFPHAADAAVARVSAPGMHAEVSTALSDALAAVAPIARETRLRRNIAHATFCLPQNVLGILYYAALEIGGGVVAVAEVNEIRIVVTRSPFGVSLGRFVFIGEAWLGAAGVLHEVGHTLPGYAHGPFYLLFEGLASLVQAGVSRVLPSFAASYLERWPEDEAERLGAAAGGSS